MLSARLQRCLHYGRGWNGRRGGTVTVWVTVLVSVLGETVTVLGGTVVVGVSVGVAVGVSVLGGGAVSVTVCVGAPPPPPWCRGGSAVVLGTVVLGMGVVVVVVLGAFGAGGPATSLTTAYAARPSTITARAPAATRAAGRRYQGVGGSGGGGPGSS
ncbi:hypothetical protein MAV_0299 [Mycobacterium terramassiliense]|uniref:Transmembrane protein n=1 Tax=Mycobacterium terramassiliense TaxID=1841859 RepID=A0A2U3NEJ4_9MYCO|nr:hypothetical protein MAV_0299 [Mycobacterium terramassiliense]